MYQFGFQFKLFFFLATITLFLPPGYLLHVDHLCVQTFNYLFLSFQELSLGLKFVLKLLKFLYGLVFLALKGVDLILQLL